MKEKAIYTVGYGKRELDELVSLLKEHGIGFLIDVRSTPYSKFRPEFSKDNLACALQREGIRYVFMGDLLGGRPAGKECYVNGKVDYERLKVTEPFRQGICRLRTAWEKGLRVCIMCSEGRPEKCHRSKLIGEVLEAEDIPVRHIDADGNVVSQQTIIQILTRGQQSLFGETFTSRKKYSSGPPLS
ncbi:DUF488 domain-containing protein [Candidatus Parcubacteria bacterium]|nr:MAG: DUF488 domain-containing protein [Candidatus Parcubacteria bacterium]